MSKFGWSYPAGAANDPFAPYNQEESPCLVCGLDVDNCQCPECPECREHGNPKCVVNQGKEWGHAAALKLMDEFGCDSLGEFYRRVYKSTGCGPTVGFLLSWTEYNDNGESGPGGTYDEEKIEWVYCDDLATPGSYVRPKYVVHDAPLDSDYYYGQIIDEAEYAKTPDSVQCVMAGGTGISLRQLPRTPYTLTDEWMRGDDPAVIVQGVSVSSIVEGIDSCTDTVVLEGTDFTVKTFWEAVEATNQQANEMWDATHGCEDCRKHWATEGITTDEWGDEMGWGSTPVWDNCEACSGLGAVI